MERAKVYDMALKSEMWLGIIKDYAVELERELGKLYGGEETKVEGQEDGVRECGQMDSIRSMMFLVYWRDFVRQQNEMYVGRVMDMDIH